MSSELLTIKEIAGKLSLPESTLRKYRDIFIKYLPYVGSGRMKKYRPQAVEIFDRIRELRMEEHLAWKDIETRLYEDYPRNADSVESEIPEGDSDEIFQYINDGFEGNANIIKREFERLEFVVTSVAQELIELRKVISDDARQTREMQTMMKQVMANVKRLVTEENNDSKGIKGTAGNSGTSSIMKKSVPGGTAHPEHSRRIAENEQHAQGARGGSGTLEELQKEIINARLQLAGYRKRNESLEQELKKLKETQSVGEQQTAKRKGAEKKEAEKGQGPDQYPTSMRKGKRFFGGNR